VVKIGTRALISINEKVVIATHWDGYPSSLGRDLIECDKSLKSVVEVAKDHKIDCCNNSIRKELEIDDIERYGDNAEYQYNIIGNEIYFRALKGYYPESLRGAEAFRLLTKKSKIIYSCRKSNNPSPLNK